MPNPTRQEIIRAHETLNNLCECLARGWGASPASIKASKDTIEKALLPKPQPTMADVEWDDDEHYLAEAEQNIYGKVIMLGLDENGMIEFLTPRSRECRYDAAYRETLTPTGKRYTLTETTND